MRPRCPKRVVTCGPLPGADFYEIKDAEDRPVRAASLGALWLLIAELRGGMPQRFVSYYYPL